VVAINNFTKRLISTLILVPSVLFLLFMADLIWFFVISGFTVCIGLYELLKIINTNTYNKVIAVSLTALLSMIIYYENTSSFYFLFNCIAIFWWLTNMYIIIKYPKLKPKGMLIAITAPLLLVPIASLYQIRIADASLLFLLLLIIWFTDIGAYIFGNLFGKNKLAPKISKGKTIEGLIGGLICVLLITLVWLYFNKISFEKYLIYLLLAIITAIFSVFGDLYISMYKRVANTKNSGNIIPGHGGILDRIDSLLAAIPVFFIGLSLL
jgi:CDP-diglyceride synthetase